MLDTTQAAYLHYRPLLNLEGQATDETIATLVLNRPEAANAFSGSLLVRLKHLLQEVAAQPKVRLLLLQGAGKHFSAGADLQWMQEAARLDYTGNCLEAEKLSAMFEALAQLPMPSLAIVKGACFGGAVGLVAACDYALALPQAKFCLSEAKIGLLPAVILPYLARKIQAVQLHRLVLTAQVFTSHEAQTIGLVQRTLVPDDMEAQLREEVKLLLSASPEAQSAYKKLHQHLAASHWQQGPATVEAIARARASQMGQAGLQAFFQKSSPPWVRTLAGGDALLVD